MLTVHDLRKHGFKVTVHHSRYISPEFGGKKRESKYLVDISMDKDLTPKMFDPRGGETIVSVSIPKKQGIIVLSTRAKCRADENYNRRLGVSIALQRIEAMMVNDLRELPSVTFFSKLPTINETK